MKDLAVYSISVIAMLECLFRLNLRTTLTQYLVLARKVKKLFFLKSVSDYLKEKAARRYSEQLFITSAKLFTILIASALIGVALFLINYDDLTQIVGVITNFSNIVFVTIITTAYLIARTNGKL